MLFHECLNLQMLEYTYVCVCQCCVYSLLRHQQLPIFFISTHFLMSVKDMFVSHEECRTCFRRKLNGHTVFQINVLTFRLR